MKKNVYKDSEHPKNLIENMANTRDSVEAYATVTKMPLAEAALILILNELRCIHWHFDMNMSEGGKSNDNGSNGNNRS